MDEDDRSRLARLEAEVEMMGKKLAALEETVRTLFREVRTLYEVEDFPPQP